MRRRTVLQAAVVLAGAVAGCGGDTETGTETAPATETATTAETTATATETATTAETTATATETATTAETTDTATQTDSGPQTVSVGANGLRFEPGDISIAVGETVRWEWGGDGHNITPGEIPADSTWTGTTDDDQYLYDAGYTHSHTFSVAGEYAYYCDPHRASGMRGSVTVTE